MHHYICDAAGVTVRPAPPPTDHPRNFKDRPVQFSVSRDGTLALHGQHFSAQMNLTSDEAIGLSMLLLFFAREDLARTQGGRK
jgi:hypothetical protein